MLNLTPRTSPISKIKTDSTLKLPRFCTPQGKIANEFAEAFQELITRYAAPAFPVLALHNSATSALLTSPTFSPCFFRFGGVVSPTPLPLDGTSCWVTNTPGQLYGRMLDSYIAPFFCCQTLNCALYRYTEERTIATLHAAL